MIWKRQRDNEGNEGKCEESIVLAAGREKDIEEEKAIEEGS